ncbi:MAG: N-acetyltransferase [Candidatus Brocadiaceae bacterium]|nr:N-acetyltransferase [Candidatus Brocadiaceae bacterium]
MIEKAKIADPPAILAIVNHFAQRELMLPRSLNDVYEALRDFFVYREDGRIIGCVALHISWQGLGEVRSLAVVQEAQNRGVGTELVRRCLDEAMEMGMRHVFALTYRPEFFKKLGFVDYPKEKLPHKIWTDCLRCPRFPECNEVAVMKDLPPGG